MFRLLSVHPADLHLFGMKWRGNIYIDHCIPFGLHSVSKLFNILANLLAWIMENAGVAYLIHYLDEYLTWVHQNLRCQQNLVIFLSRCAELGVLFAAENLEGPTTSLSILLDTKHMEMCKLPADKLTSC